MSWLAGKGLTHVLLKYQLVFYIYLRLEFRQMTENISIDEK